MIKIVGEHQGEYEKASTDVVDTKTADDSSSTTAVAPMPGIIEKILVKAGEKVCCLLFCFYCKQSQFMSEIFERNL